MNMSKAVIAGILATAAVAGVAALHGQPAAADGNNSCTLVANSHAWVQVWDEQANNSRGIQRVGEREIQKDQEIGRIDTTRGRIIYVYRYGAGDPWNPEVHAWCHHGDRVRIP
jgi:hypothetical protein